jgi:hypothetical protein
MVRSLNQINIIQPEASQVLPDLPALSRATGRFRKGPGSSLQLAREKALIEASTIIKPSAIWAKIDIPGDDSSYTPVWLAKKASQVESIAGVVCTIGNQLEILSRKYFSEGQYTRGYLLDQVGSLSVARLANWVSDLLRRKLNALYWAPGDDTNDVTLSTQRWLFEIIPAQKIGVRLTDQNVMAPVKSLSFFLLIWTGQTGLKCAIPCQRCVWNGACDRRLKKTSPGNTVV